MPLSEIAFVLESAVQFCTEEGVSLMVFPMHEIAAHPDAPKVMTLFQEVAGGELLFEPLSTTGVPLVQRQDWEALLSSCRALGTTTIFLAVHGVGDVHDQAVYRVGAYQETLLAAERAQSIGFKVGCNVFLTKTNISQFDTMVEDLQRRGVTEFSFEPATYYSTGRGRRSESLRPELQELLPLADRVIGLSPHHRPQWSSLEAYTEAAYVQAALEGRWGEQYVHDEQVLNIVCRPNLDLYHGIAGLYRECFGNLRNDTPRSILQRAFQVETHSYDQLWFPLDPIPGIQELAAQSGDVNGLRIHFSEQSMRFRWLDLAKRARLRA
jgi:hypothetical protein